MTDDLSPDLEWMLQSEQIKVDSLIETLFINYYQHIYLLALSKTILPGRSSPGNSRDSDPGYLAEKDVPRGKFALQNG